MVSSTNSYVVLARKWRPAQFADIVGQSAIVRTLMNAIQAERVHHAYLLTGSRGIGKTSIARIFAKVLRCEATTWDALPGAAPDAAASKVLRSCDACSSCKEIASGASVDVIEIDGASNNGVDAVREIRENAKYLPASGQKKIYIIDEVHMLTTAAFNALLKTLEEPPAHVVFLFATTEPHKIPGTILSRCQRFDLRRVTSAQIQGRLTEVLKVEGVEVESAALALIARAADGGMRDALSLLDQVLAYSGSKITATAVRESVGLVETQLLQSILRGVFERKATEALAGVEEAYRQGHDLRVLTRGLIELVHAAILLKVGAQSASLEVGQEDLDALKAIADLRELEEMELIFQVLHQGVDWIARSPQPKLVLDVLLVKCACAEMLVTVGEAAPSGARGGSGQSLSQGTTSARLSSASSAPMVRTAPTTEDASPAQRTQLSPGAQATPAVTPAPQPSQPATAPQTSAAPSAAPQAAANTNFLTGGFASVGGASGGLFQGSNAASAGATPAQPAAPARVRPAGPASWEGFIAWVKAERPLLASILENGAPEGPLPDPAVADADTLLLCFGLNDGYYTEQLQARVYAEELNAYAKSYFGRSVRFRYELKQIGESVALRRERERAAWEDSARKAAQSHPIIAEARSLFGGDLSPIELIEPKPDGGSHA